VSKNGLLEPAEGVTVECWVKLAAVPMDQSYLGLVSYGQTVAEPWQPYVLQFHAGNANLYVGGGWITGATVLQKSSVYHVVGMFDRAQHRLTVYVNGDMDATGDQSVSPSYTADQEGLGIGADNFEGRGAMMGILDEVAIYDHALDGGTVSAHYAAGSSP
jgi:hypothetical protein